MVTAEQAASRLGIDSRIIRQVIGMAEVKAGNRFSLDELRHLVLKHGPFTNPGTRTDRATRMVAL
jgi:hypothetical protein